MGKIKPNSLSTGGKIPSPNIPPSDDNLAFNFKHLDFKHLDLVHDKFSLSDCEAGYLYKFLERLKSLNMLTLAEVQTNRTSVLRAHPIDWKDTTEAAGFPLNEQLKAIAA